MDLPESALVIEKLNCEYEMLQKSYGELEQHVDGAKKIFLGKFFVFTKEEQRALMKHLQITPEDYQELIEKHLQDKYLKYKY